MRRLLTSLPIALLLLLALTFSTSAKASDYVSSDQFTVESGNLNTISHDFVPNALAAADNATALPSGLDLAKGVPFISPGEVNKGDPVTIKVKATNSSQAQITYTLSPTINGKPGGTPQQLSIDPSASKDIVFQVTAQTVGNNDVKVGSLQGFFTVKEGSFFDMFPTYLWVFFGVIAAVIILLVVLMVLKPPKKKAGAMAEQGKKQPRPKGKPGRPGFPEPQMQGGGAGPRQGMSNMQEGMMFNMQGQPGSTQDMGGMQQFQTPQGMQQPFPGQPGMQQPYQSSQQPGMPSQFQQPGGMQQQFQPPQAQGMPQQFSPQPGMQQFQPPQQPGQQIPQPGMQQPQMRGPQYPPPPQMPHGGPQSVQQPTQGMPMQPGMQYGGQPPQPQMPHGMQPMQPMGQPPMPPSMHSPMPSGPQQQHGGLYQSMGMPKFSVSNLTITPNSVKVGEPISISIIVSNNGVQTGKYSVVLRVGGVVENISDLTLPPGASQAASFTVIKDTAGDYYADIDGLGGFFTVIPLAPPSFTVTNFSVGPERARQGQPISVTASVTNMGEITGSHTLILRVKGIAESQRDITLGPGKMENVEFQIIKDTPGFYPVALENWTGKFVVEMDWTG